MKLRVNYYLCGYADARDHTIYHRGPDGTDVAPPPLPNDRLSRDWRAYLEGLQGACLDTMTKLKGPNQHV